MKTLGLFRHAKSDWHDRRARDFDRPLNLRGRRGAEIMGQHIAAYPVAWNRIIASPAVRAGETIELAAKAAGRSFAVNWDRRIYLASSATLIDLLREADNAWSSVMLVGHNPGLEDVIFDLIPDDGSSPLRGSVESKFPTAAFAVIECDVESWAQLGHGGARLVHLMRPRDLDPTLGPQPN